MVQCFQAVCTHKGVPFRFTLSDIALNELAIYPANGRESASNDGSTVAGVSGSERMDGHLQHSRDAPHIDRVQRSRQVPSGAVATRAHLHAVPAAPAAAVPVSARPPAAVPVSARPPAASPPYEYVPFGGGRRECVGQGYAKLLLKIFTIELVRHANFRLENSRPQMVDMPVPHPRDNLPLVIRQSPTELRRRAFTMPW